MSFGLRFAVFSVLVLGLAMPAHAQEGDGARISGFFSGAIGEGETNVGTGGSVGYRFNSRFGFDFEALALPDFDIGTPYVDLRIADARISRRGRGVAFLTNFVTEFPSPATWLTPYVHGGGGVANIKHSYGLEYVDSLGQRLPMPFGDRRGRPTSSGVDARLAGLDVSRSETNLALSVGGGIDFRLWRGLSIGPNITFMKFLGTFEDIDLTNIGARASYRF
jgi:opacity protein-like surface antigen